METEKKISLTDAALKRILEITKTGECLSITVEPGGCNGFEYKFEIKSCDDVLLRPSLVSLNKNSHNISGPLTYEPSTISKHDIETARNSAGCPQSESEPVHSQNLADTVQDEMIHISKEGTYYVTWSGRTVLEVDNASLELIRFAKLDYVRELVGERFVIKNPNSQSTCSCGNSFGI